jgi:alpha-beta hydrolase superfamily lysophospholipase
MTQAACFARRWLRRSPSRNQAGHGRQTANQQEANMSTSTATPTIVLIHGLFATPLSWEHRIQRHSAESYDVFAPAFKEFSERPHFTLGVDGWEEVADDALHRALRPTPSVEEL